MTTTAASGAYTESTSTIVDFRQSTEVLARGWAVKVPEAETGAMCYCFIGKPGCTPHLADDTVVARALELTAILQRWWTHTRLAVPGFEIVRVEKRLMPEQWRPVPLPELAGVRAYNPKRPGEYVEFAKAPGVLHVRWRAGVRWVEMGE